MREQFWWVFSAISAGLLAALAGSAAATAQTCSADSQCQRGGPPTQAMCSGDTVVIRRSLCQGGQCRDVEDRRQNCGAGTSMRCAAGGVERTSSRCDGLLGRCVTRVDLEPCFPSCTCHGKRLTVSSGQCLSNLGCQRSTLVCPKGCACAPTPRCLD
jgi:hypothetical protein